MKLFITGIGTDVGKTIASAICRIARSRLLKPIQAGDLENSDSHKVKLFLSNEKNSNSFNSYALNTPASPHLLQNVMELPLI
jgi:dethiobiotin synthetase